MSWFPLLERGKTLVRLLGVEKKMGSVMSPDMILPILDRLGPVVDRMSAITGDSTDVRVLTDAGFDEGQARVMAGILRELDRVPEEVAYSIWSAVNDPRVVLTLLYHSNPVKGLRGLVDHAIRRRFGSLPALARQAETYDQMMTDLGIERRPVWSAVLGELERRLEASTQPIDGNALFSPDSTSDRPQQLQRTSRRRRRRRAKKRDPKAA